MAQLLRLARGVDRPPVPQAYPRRAVDRRRNANSRAGQDLARLPMVNLFVVGADGEVAKAIASLRPRLDTPIVVRHRGEPLRLPPTSPASGTIVVHDVDTLTRHEQHALNQWVSAGKGRARVVSTASAALFPLVEAGFFTDELYYRLNVMTIDLT